MKKKIAGILALTVLVVTCFGAAASYAAESYVEEYYAEEAYAEDILFAENTGWNYDGIGWWYQYADGTYPAGTWAWIDNAWYYFDVNGYMYTGWLWDSAWYYLKPDGTMATGWTYIDGYYYYLNSSGVMLTGWLWDGAWYYLNGSGAMQTGWLLDGYWYYLNPDGSMATGWIFDGMDYYYLNQSGVMLTGWIEVDDHWYYMNASGKMQTGWFWTDASGYYLQPDGSMATGVTVIDGIEYYFTDNGQIVLAAGSSGAPVYVLQQLLNDMGYLPAGPDGYYGESTVDAVAVFQQRAGVEVTGVADVLTISLILQKSRTPIVQAMRLGKNVLNTIGWDLYTAYKWCVDVPYTSADTGYTIADAAIYGFTNNQADCVAKAATFCIFARLFGYECNLIYGSVPLRTGGYGVHGWTEITVNGTTYVCDPEFERETGRTGYMINYGQSGTWRYVKEAVWYE